MLDRTTSSRIASEKAGELEKDAALDCREPAANGSAGWWILPAVVSGTLMWVGLFAAIW